MTTDQSFLARLREARSDATRGLNVRDDDVWVVQPGRGGLLSLSHDMVDGTRSVVAEQIAPWNADMVLLLVNNAAKIEALIEQAARQVRESHEDDVDLELAAALDALNAPPRWEVVNRDDVCGAPVRGGFYCVKPKHHNGGHGDD